MCPSVYKILVILCHKLLQFCFNCTKTFHINLSYIEVLQDKILKCQLLLLEELCPLELRFFFFEIACFSQSSGGGINSNSVTAVVSNTFFLRIVKTMNDSISLKSLWLPLVESRTLPNLLPIYSLPDDKIIA